VRVLKIHHGLGLSLAERRLVCTRTGGSGTGATVTPEGEDHVKGQACLGCKRNILLPLTLIGQFLTPSAAQLAPVSDE
jgi:hypothetical protein